VVVDDEEVTIRPWVGGGVVVVGGVDLVVIVIGPLGTVGVVVVGTAVIVTVRPWPTCTRTPTGLLGAVGVGAVGVGAVLVGAVATAVVTVGAVLVGAVVGGAEPVDVVWVPTG
jgi:hypothetical protein